MTAITDKIRDIHSCKVSYRRSGEGETLLLLHGIDGRTAWDGMFLSLAKHYDVILPDHPGFASSGSAEWIDSVTDLALFYLDFLDELEIESCHVAGHCLGGWLAAEISVMQPKRVKKLILCSAAGIRVDETPMGDPFLWNPSETIRNLFVREDIRESMQAAPQNESDLETMLKARQTSARLAWYPRFHNPSLKKWLHRLTMPTLIQWGDSDRVFPEAYARAFHKMIPRSQLEVYPDCGHMPMREAPELFLQHMSTFLATALR